MPRSVSLPALAQALTGVAGVLAVSDLHVWELSAERNAATAQVHLATLAGWPQLLEALREVAHAHGIEHCTFQPALDPDALQDQLL